MIVDHSILTRTGTAYDLVVVGGGAAGLTLAEAAGANGLHVLLIEAGGFHQTTSGRAALAGELVTPGVHPALDLYRVRALGGASRIWGGRCIPMDPIDFEPRKWIPHSGWPIAYDEIAAYYPQAVGVAEAGQSAFEPSAVLADEQPELAPGLDGKTVRTTIERFSRPTNFWKRFAETLTASSRVQVLPDTCLARVALDENGSAVRAVVVMDRAGRKYEVRASNFALALGGLETTRILLASRDVKPAGIGNDFDQLGRYYMSHLCTNGGVVDFTKSAHSLAYDYERDPDGIYVRRRLWLTEDTQRAFRLANITFRTHLPDPGNPAHRNGILSAMFLSKSFVQREYAAKFSEGQITPSDYFRHVANVLRDPPALARFAALWMRKRVLSDRKLPSVVLPSANHHYQLEFHAEQLPNPDSRVGLSTALDKNGLPRLKVDWRLLDDDVEGIVRAHHVLKDELERTGTGQLWFDDDTLRSRIRLNSIVGGHHLGTTRMSRTPRTGVVDGDCRVHGIANLYIASASVMPTSGQANPTLTIIALALRLSKHLNNRRASVPEMTSEAEPVAADAKSRMLVDIA
jgi:choline dehydrogenase-like flavoprotein